MVRGRRWAWYENWFVVQEDAWERHSRLMAKLHESELIISRSIGGGELPPDAFKDADHFNDWLRVAGVIMPEHERHALEQEQIAEQRLAKAAALERQAKEAAISDVCRNDNL